MKLKTRKRNWLVNLSKRVHNIVNLVCILIIRNSQAGGQIIKVVVLLLKFLVKIGQLGRSDCRTEWIKDIQSRCLKDTSLILFILCQIIDKIRN